MAPNFWKPIPVLTIIAVILAAGYGWIEYRVFQQDPQKADTAALIDESLNTAEEIFSDIHDTFAENTLRLHQEIYSGLESGSEPGAYHDQMASYPFWGSSLYRNNLIYVWEGFAPDSVNIDEDVANETLSITVERSRNVIYLAGHMRFQVESGDSYDLFTRQKIEQQNILPIAQSQEYNLAELPALKNRFPVDFIFFDALPDSINDYRVLSTSSTDSAGVVIANAADIDNLIVQYDSRVYRWRSIFHALMFTFATSIFLFFSFRVPSWYGMMIQLIGLFLLWMAFIITDIPIGWIPEFFPDADDATITSLIAITGYAVNTLFLFFITMSVITTLTRKWRITQNDNLLKTFLYAAVFGGLSVGLILYYFHLTYQAGLDADIPLIDLQVIPGLTTWAFFISAGLFISSIAALLMSLLWFLFICEKDKTTLVTAVSILSFLCFYLLADQFLTTSLFTFWIFTLCSLIFAIVLLGGLYVFRYPRSFLQISGFRLMLISILLSAAAGYTIFSSSHYERMDRRLLTEASGFMQEEDEEARNVASGMLSSIEEDLAHLTQVDLTQNNASVQTQFLRAAQESLPLQRDRYSYDVRLVTPTGEIISDYVTNFGTSIDYYRIDRLTLAYNFQQFNHNVNRPIVLPGPLAAANDYSTFFFGGIPIYDRSQANERIAWIIAAVYIERSDLSKPLRAVLEASTSDDWKRSFSLVEFQDGVNVRSTVKGIFANQPSYNTLPESEQVLADSDSIAYLTTPTERGEFRELLLKSGPTSVIKVSTPFPGFNSHLFSFFRFLIVVTIASLIMFPMFSMLGFEVFSLFTQSRKFRDKLIDGLTLTTILFLILLTVATHYAVSEQNETTLQRELISKLDNMAETNTFEELTDGTISSGNITLASATAPLDADAIFYRNGTEFISTTPQIFQQSLIPRLLPYPVYDNLYNQQRNQTIMTLNIGRESLLAGYHMIRAEDNEPLGVVAIPTFLNSPIYTEQLLETTSYLLTFYLFIFGVFIIGTFFFTRQLTKPLQFIQIGLNKISDGSLETRMPVRSRDEIGSLSSAYNNMVDRLKELQKNLVEAEREAAWKEMAQQVAHEIKNPLTPMKLNLQHLQRHIKQHPDDVVQLREQIERVTVNIIEQIDSLSKIASDFSKFGRPISNEFRDVEINELITSVTDLYRPDAPISIINETGTEKFYIKGAADELKRTLINLVKNSIEASDAGGILTIRTFQKRHMVIIEVEDNGNGIPATDHEKIFVPNFSTKSSGTGLGLAISKKIIEAHHGRIYFRSEEGVGSTFVIELPLNGAGGNDL